MLIFLVLVGECVEDLDCLKILKRQGNIEKWIEVLKNCSQVSDKIVSNLTSSQLGGTFMSKKPDGHANKKKMTKKEIKAMNHAKLMASKGGGASNVVDLNAYKEQQNKKAA
jgi:hypothetical protein